MSSAPSGTSIWDTVARATTPRGSIEYALTGTGPCVLVIHGTPGSWRQAMTLGADLHGSNTVVAPSRPGYGTTPLATGRTYGEQADAYAALLDHLGIASAVVVGASGGGPSSIAFAERHPDRTEGLVLACAMVPHLIEIPTGLRLLTIPVLGEGLSALTRVIGRRRLDDQRAIDRAIAKDLTPDEQRRVAADPTIRTDLVAFARTHQDAPAGLRGIRNDLAQVMAAKRGGERVYTVEAPTLVLQGTADVVVPMSHAEHLATSIADATLETYDDAGHIFFVTRRADASARIARFAQDARGAR